MHIVGFRIELADVGVGEREVIEVDIDGVDLREYVRPIEEPFAIAADTPSLTAAYSGLAAVAVAWPSRHYLGEPEETWYRENEAIILGCDCGIADCWPLLARVSVGPTTVIWRDFRNGHRTWDLSALGPFTFDRDQYESALRATER